MSDWTEERLTMAAMRAVTFEVALPNVYALGEAESDLLGVTKARILYEFEAKVTLSDLRADLQGEPLSPKWCRQQVMSALHAGGPPILGWARDAWTPRHASKTARPVTDPEEWAHLTGQRGFGHREIPQRAPLAPMHFYYIYPEERAAEFDPLIPPYAGIVHVRHHAEIARKAPRLHKDKAVSARAEDTMLRSAYYRFWQTRQRLRKAQNDNEYLRRRLGELP